MKEKQSAIKYELLDEIPLDGIASIFILLLQSCVGDATTTTATKLFIVRDQKLNSVKQNVRFKRNAMDTVASAAAAMTRNDIYSDLVAGDIIEEKQNTNIKSSNNIDVDVDMANWRININLGYRLVISFVYVSQYNKCITCLAYVHVCT